MQYGTTITLISADQLAGAHFPEYQCAIVRDGEDVLTVRREHDIIHPTAVSDELTNNCTSFYIPQDQLVCGFAQCGNKGLAVGAEDNA